MRDATFAELAGVIHAHARRQARTLDEMAWVVAHLLVGGGTLRKDVRVGPLMRDLLGREPGTLPGAAPVERVAPSEPPPSRELSPEASVAYMAAWMRGRPLVPRVVIELQANTQAAVQQIQDFAKAQKDAFDAVRAGNPALLEASVKVSKLTENTSQAVKASESANRAFRSFASQGVAQLANEIPGVGGALAQLAQTLGTFPLLIGAAVAVGIGFVKMLQQWEDDARKADAATLKLAESIGTTTKKSLLEVQEIRARAAGDDARVLALQTEQALAEAERVKQGRIKKAREESEQGALFGLLRKQMSLEALQEIDAAEAEFAAKRKVIQATALADQQKLDKTRREEAEKWFEKEAARFQALEDMAVTLSRAQLAATLAGQTGAAGRTGDPAALVRAQYAERTAAIRQSYEDQLKIQDAALAKGEIVDKEYAARRQALQDTAAIQQKTLADQFAADETAALAKIDAAALEALRAARARGSRR